MPESFWHDPLMYQGGADAFIPPHSPIRLADEAWGIDLEGELAVITDDVPMGATPAEAAAHIQLLMLVNDVSLRNLIPGELAWASVSTRASRRRASPVAVTPDELGETWRDGKVHRPLVSHINGELFGQPDAGTDMTFNFPTLVAHAARTRPLGAGTIIGSGTVSNYDRSAGSSCLGEAHARGHRARRGEDAVPRPATGCVSRCSMPPGRASSAPSISRPSAMSTELTLYGYWRSSAAYRVRIALNLKGLAYRQVPVHLVKDGGQQRAADYRALNPQQLVPLLVDEANGGARISQSLAILSTSTRCFRCRPCCRPIRSSAPRCARWPCTSPARSIR